MLLFGCFLVPMVFAIIDKPLINTDYMQKRLLPHDEWLNESITTSLNQNPNGSVKVVDTLVIGQSIYNVSQALFECSLFLDRKKNETEFQSMIENVDKVGLGISKRLIEQSDIDPGIEKNVQVKLCIHQGRVTSLEILMENEVLSTGCTEVKVNLNKQSISLRRFGVSSFAKGWYRLQSLSINFLDLSSNDIANVTSELFNDLPGDLSSVSLANNQIESLEKGVIFNKNLRQLSLENNFISYIADGALQDTELSSFFISVNQLTNTRFVATLPSTLKTIIMNENQIQEISPRSFARLNRLEILSVAQNSITEIKSQSFRGLLSLKRLIIAENNLKTVEPGSFNDLKELVFLNLYQNNLTSLETGIFDDLKNLKYLNIGFNKLTKISPDFLRGLSDTLQELYLDFNRIESLESGTFVDIPKYRLSLRGNKITTIKKGSFRLPRLQELNLEANLLSILNGDAFEDVENLSHLILRKNCIKEIENFIFWTRRMLRLKSGNAVVFFDCQQQEGPSLRC